MSGYNHRNHRGESFGPPQSYPRFSFEYMYGGRPIQTIYSTENQEKIRQWIEEFTTKKLDLYHLVESGRDAGQMNHHTISYDTRSIYNNTTGMSYKLIDAKQSETERMKIQSDREAARESLRRRIIIHSEAREREERQAREREERHAREREERQAREREEREIDDEEDASGLQRWIEARKTTPRIYYNKYLKYKNKYMSLRDIEQK
jgi:hypothetical protein